MSTQLTVFRPVIPDHRLITLIGGGSYGQIWLAQNVAGAFRAVKVVSRSNFHSDRPYEREFEGLQRFEPISRSHEGFLQILHIGRNDVDGYFYYVMELGDSQDEAWREDPAKYSPRTLASELEAHLHLPLDRCLEIGLELSAALARLHQQGLVHRDLKPANIVFVNRRPKLADIGLVTEAGNAVTFVGTEGYVPREGPGAPNADIFALGKILYEMATGFDCSRFPDLPETPPTAVGNLTFAEWNEVVCKCCDEDPRRRYQQAEDLRFHLSLLKAGSSLQRLLRLERTLQKIRRLALPGLLLLLALAALGFSLWRSEQDAAEISRRGVELSQRKIGAFVATGSQAMETRDFSGALPWFAAALALSDSDPMASETHRVRMAAVLDRSPKLKQLWFSEREARFGQFTTNGESALVQSRSGRFQLRRIADGSELSPEFGSLPGEELACLSADGSVALTASRRESVVRLWDLRSDQPVAMIQCPTWVTAARLSPTGERFVAGLYDGSVVIQDRGTKKPVVMRAHSKRVLHVTFDRQGDRVLSCGEDGQAFVWDGRTGRQIARCPDHESWVTWGAFSPDGSRVVTASFDRTLRIWDPKDGSQLLPMPFELSSVARSVEYSEDGKSLVLCDFEFRVLILDATTGRVTGPILHHGEHVVFASLSPSGREVLSVSQDGTTRVWELPVEKPAASWQVLDFQPDGQWGVLTTNGQNSAIALPSGKVIAPLQPFFMDPISRLRAMHGGQDCAVLTTLLDRESESEPVRLLQRLSLGQGDIQTNRVRLPSAFERFVVLKKASQVACWSPNEVRMYDLKLGRLVWSVEFAGVRVQQVFADALGQRVAVAMVTKGSQVIQLLEISDGRALWPSPVSVSGEIKSVAISPDGRLVAVACSSSPARSEAAFLFETATGGPVGEPMVHRDGVLYTCFNPQGSLLVTCGEDKAALLWNPGNGQQVVRPLIHGDQVVRAAFSRDGRWLVTLARNQAVQVWDVSTGDAITPPFTPSQRCSEIAFSEGAQGIWAWAPADGNESGTVSWIPLRRESGSVEDLSAISRVLSAQHYHFSGALMPSPRELLRESWERVRQAAR